MLTKEFDSFINQYADQNPIWIAELSNGETIYQDDGRDEIEPSSAWLRLKSYCEKNSVSIVGMKIKNRSNIEDVTDTDAEAYFFCKGASAFMFSEETTQSFINGTLKDGNLHTRTWRLPELKVDHSDNRNPHDYTECLIFNQDLSDAGKIQV